MRTIKSIVFFSFAFLLCCVFFEIFLYIGGILDPIVTINPKYGERYCPNKTSCSIFVTEGFGMARTNSAGWFGKQFNDAGPNNISVGVIGSSWVASRQVFYRDNFLSVAQKSVNERLHGKTVSLYNFGKEDLPLKEMLYIKDEVVSTYHPDELLILLNKGIFRDDSHRYVTFYNLVNNKFELDTSFKQKPFVKNFLKFHTLTRSSFIFLLDRVKNRLPDIDEIFFDKFYYLFSGEKTSSEITIDSISVEDKRVIQELAKDKKVTFIWNFDKNLSEQILPLIGSAPYIDLSPALQKMQQEGIDPYYWSITNEKGHWNIPAHRVVGKEIADYMVKMINHSNY